MKHRWPQEDNNLDSECVCVRVLFTASLSSSFAFFFPLTFAFVPRSRRAVCMCAWTHSWGLDENTWRDTIAKQDRVCTCTSNGTSKRYAPPNPRPGSRLVFSAATFLKFPKGFYYDKISFLKATLCWLRHLPSQVCEARQHGSRDHLFYRTMLFFMLTLTFSIV